MPTISAERTQITATVLHPIISIHVTSLVIPAVRIIHRKMPKEVTQFKVLLKDFLAGVEDNKKPQSG
jgi:hypothetical protein